MWSFGNNGKDYLYSKEIESFKKAYHYAVFFKDYSIFEEQDIKIPHSAEEDIYKRYAITKRALINRYQSIKEDKFLELKDEFYHNYKGK